MQLAEFSRGISTFGAIFLYWFFNHVAIASVFRSFLILSLFFHGYVVYIDVECVNTQNST